MKRPGMMIREVLRSAVRPPVTIRYPFVKAQVPKKFRGRLSFNPGSCIGCKICERDCPSAAINIKKIADKKFECDVDLARCIYCGQCVDSCPKKSLATTENFELAALNRETLKFHYQGQERSTHVVEEKPAAAKPATAVVAAKPPAPAAPANPAEAAKPVAEAAKVADAPKAAEAPKRAEPSNPQ